MIKKFLSKIWIGAATVNLVLDDSRGRIGEEVSGKILVEGGNVDQKIDAIHVDFLLEARLDDRTARSRIQSVTVAQGLQVRAGEKLEFPFRHQLPELPQSTHYVRYTYHTRLDIPQALDTHDFDEFILLPRPSTATAQNALHALGFRDKQESGVFNGHYQEFEYRPVQGPFAGRIDELEVVYITEDRGLVLHIELDKKVKGLLGALADKLDLDESHFTLRLSFDTLRDPEATLNTIHKALESELNNPKPNRYPTLPRVRNKPKHSGRSHGVGGAIAGGIAGYAIGDLLFGGKSGDES
ncbi:sporulation protein [Tumebacillus algifaecis]|uniref:sporulation protein n=1 Tax=Tumebacillus algifaecis TaxID=1214604 RepID=UPI0012FD9EF9|nr:sporulation protein [Tumebacillus algifaecis]